MATSPHHTHTCTHSHALITSPLCLFISLLCSTSGTPLPLTSSSISSYILHHLSIRFSLLSLLSSVSLLFSHHLYLHPLLLTFSSVAVFVFLSCSVYVSWYKLQIFCLVSTYTYSPSLSLSPPSPTQWQVPLSCFSRLACSPPDGWPHANINLL